METQSKVEETFKLTETHVTPRKSTINAFSDDLLNCQLCHSRFKNPKSLPCLHSFCETCLDIYIAKLPGIKRFFPCPTCQELHPTPKTEAISRWADGITAMSLPPMSSRSSVIDDQTARSENLNMALQIRNADRRCDPCMESDEMVTAMYWCPTCREALCDMCTKSHRGMKITKGHALMDIDDVKERPSRLLQPHDVGSGNRLFDTVTGVDKMAHNIRSKRTNKDLVQRLRYCINIVESVLAAKEGCRDRLVTRKLGILDEVSKLKNSVIQLLNELEEKMKDELESVSREYEDILQTKIDRSRGLRDTIQSSMSIMENTVATGSDYQQVIAQQTMKEECDKYEAMADEERIDFREIDLVFTPDENLVRLAKLVDRLGFVEISEKNQVSKPFRNCSAQKSGIINGKIKGDRNGCIFNSVDISDTGDIVLSDFNNYTVKLFDQFGMFRSATKLNTPPRGVCILPDKLIAVALPEECVLKLMSIDGKFLAHVRELHTSFKAYRICDFRGKIMGICYSKACRSLSIIERNGRVERTVTRKRDYKGLGGVAFDPIKNYMYMSDRDAITCFNSAGKQVFRNTYRRTDLRGMALDCQGNLYVCSHDSGQILQIAPDGTLIKSILVPISPQDVAVEPMGNKMIVVGLGEVIHVYNLV